MNDGTFRNWKLEFQYIFDVFCRGNSRTTLGGLYAFVICALLVLLGCISVLGGGSDFMLLNVGLGPIFGPMSADLPPVSQRSPMPLKSRKT